MKEVKRCVILTEDEAKADLIEWAVNTLVNDPSCARELIESGHIASYGAYCKLVGGNLASQYTELNIGEDKYGTETVVLMRSPHYAMPICLHDGEQTHPEICVPGTYWSSVSAKAGCRS